jgi:hypothetical protein
VGSARGLLIARLPVIGAMCGQRQRRDRRGRGRRVESDVLGSAKIWEHAEDLEREEITCLRIALDELYIKITCNLIAFN